MNSILGKKDFLNIKSTRKKTINIINKKDIIEIINEFFSSPYKSKLITNIPIGKIDEANTIAKSIFNLLFVESNIISI